MAIATLKLLVVSTYSHPALGAPKALAFLLRSVMQGLSMPESLIWKAPEGISEQLLVQSQFFLQTRFLDPIHSSA